MTATKSAPLNLCTASVKTGVAVGTVRYWILTGLLPAKKNGGRWEIDAEDLEVANQKSLAAAPKGRGRGPRGKLVLTNPDQ